MNRLLYFVDPMCSWCYGFAPEMSRVRDHLAGDVPIDVILGGLRAGETRGTKASVRDEIQHHWRQVQTASGQLFTFDGALTDGFVYNTEPACRAVVVARRLQPVLVFDVLDAIHTAFYAETRDVTSVEVLADCAVGAGIDRDAFVTAFDTGAARAETEADFERTRDHAVMGFPALMLDTGERKRVIAMGWQRFEDFRPVLDARMAAG